MLLSKNLSQTWVCVLAPIVACLVLILSPMEGLASPTSNLASPTSNLASWEEETVDVSRTTAVVDLKLTKTERKALKKRKKLELRWGFDVDAFLEQYGYLETIPTIISQRKVQIHSKLERKHAVRQFQEYFGIKATGKINKKTAKVMREPRCHIPDLRIEDNYSPIRQFHFYKYYPRWRRSIITWRANKFTRKISPLTLWKTIKKAFDTWSAVTGLRFLYTRQTPDLQIDFETGDHGDGSKIAFDGEGGVTSHSFGPGTYTISGDIHLDEDEKWTLSVDPKDGTNLLAVMIHQIGHALGLQHSTDPRSVMYPAFVSTNLDLSQEDIEHAQRLYGENPNAKPKEIIEPTTPAPKVCLIPMDDIELGPDGYTYIFHREHLLQLDKRGKVVKTKRDVTISERYENGPSRVDAVAFRAEWKVTYMFYNNTVWRYTNFDLDQGYPKQVASMPQTLHAAAFVRDQYGYTRLLMFGVDEFWEWSTAYDRVKAGYPLPTSQYFEGLPKSPSGALRHKDGYIYFFKRDKVYKVHPGTYNVISGYPKPMPPAWMIDIC